MNPEVLAELARGVAALALFGATGWIAYLLGLAWLPRARASVRWSGVAILGLWLAVAVFWLLTPVHAFRLAVLLPVAGLGAVLLHRAGGVRRLEPVRRLRSDLGGVRQFLASLGRLERILAATVAIVTGVRFLRALASPPLAWDDLTYHLLKAGRFVQAGGFTDAPAPDVWGSYGYFPVVGEVLWSWAMLPVRSDGLVALAALLIWSLAPLAVYAGVRELGAERRPAVLASLAVAAMPAALALVSTAYVDNVTLATISLGSVFVVRVLQGTDLRERIREAPLAIGALGLAAGTKLLAVPLLALGGAVVLVQVGRARGSLRLRGAILGTCLLAALVAAPTYARAWIEQGSPFYPFRIQILGVELSAGNPEAVAVTRRILRDPATRYSPLDSLRFLLSRPKPSGAFLNPGLGAAVLLVLAVASIRRRGGKGVLPTLYLWSVAGLFLAAFYSPVMEIFRTTFMVTTSGRYITPAFAALGVLAARQDSRVARILWTVAIAWGAVFSLPRAWSEAGLWATAWVVLPVAVLVAGAVVGSVLFRRHRIPSRAAGVVVGLLAAGAASVGLHAVRDAFRYPIYEAAADAVDPAFQLHPLHWRYASAWPVWKALDGDRHRTIAATAGFQGLGHNWYLYPLLGSRLQNEVVYVPVSRSGEVIDYRLRGRVAREAGLSCWLDRLRDAGVDVVASLDPRSTVEDRWMKGLPGVFEPEVVTPGDIHAAFRFHREELEGVPLEDYCSAGPVPLSRISS